MEYKNKDSVVELLELGGKGGSYLKPLTLIMELWANVMLMMLKGTQEAWQ